MQIKKLHSVYHYIIPDNINFRNRFSLKTIALSILLCATFSIFNYSIELDYKLTLFTTFTTLFFIWLYWLARFRNRFLLVRKIFMGYILFALNCLWFLNGGSQGPTLLIFQALFALGLFIIPLRIFTISCVVFTINLTGLFTIEYLAPQYIIGYNSDMARIMDLYLINIVFLITEIPLIHYANKNYKSEQLKAERSERVKSAFLANMSHEIRTPMNVLLGFAELLRDKDISLAEKNQYLDIIQKNGNILLHILDNVLDLSKLDANSMVVNKCPVRLNSFLSGLKISHSHYAESKNIEIRIKRDAQLESPIILSDENILHQILNNLINNAIKFTNEGVITIGYFLNENRSKIIFFVSDTGIGIAPSVVPFVFERFRQGDERLKREYSGTGLGLTIAKALVELLDGQIWLQSVLGEGTTVYFSVDLTILKQLENPKTYCKEIIC